MSDYKRKFPGETCVLCKKNKKTGIKYCDPCKERVVAKRAAGYHKKWMDNLRAGTVRERIIYGGKLTPWALAHKKEALAIARKIKGEEYRATALKLLGVTR